MLKSIGFPGSAVRPSTQEKQESDNDPLCKPLAPVLRIGQLFGVIPLATAKENNSRFVHSWRTPFPWLNLIWTLIHSTVCFYFFPLFMSRLHPSLSKTAFYTYVLSIAFQSLSTVGIYLCGNYNAARLIPAQEELYAVTRELANPKFSHGWLLTNLPSAYLIFEFLSSIILPIFMYSFTPLGQSAFIMISTSIFFLQFIPDILACAYCVILWIVGNNFCVINEKLKEALNIHPRNMVAEFQISSEVSRLRILHERLCGGVNMIQNAFGYQMLALVVGSSASSIAGIYAIVVNIQGLLPGGYSSAAFIRPLYTTIVSSCRAILILFLCQRVIASAKRPMYTLNEYNGNSKCKEIREQIDKFQSKIGNFPLRMHCCDIFEMGTPFFANGVMTSITYLLILIQFSQDEVPLPVHELLNKAIAD